MIDELSPIAEYMAAEINANAHGTSAARMRELNAFSADACVHDWLRLPIWQQFLLAGEPSQCFDRERSARGGAILLWTQMVMTGSHWDHKPKIAHRFVSATTHSGYWHCHGDEDWYYDVWSNIHYGYVGTAAQFSESMLLDGAGLEQIGSTLIQHQRIAPRTPGVAGMRAWDDPPDQEAIARGIALQKSTPVGLTPRTLLDCVLSLKLATRRPHQPVRP